VVIKMLLTYLLMNVFSSCYSTLKPIKTNVETNVQQQYPCASRNPKMVLLAYYLDFLTPNKLKTDEQTPTFSLLTS